MSLKVVQLKPLDVSCLCCLSERVFGGVIGRKEEGESWNLENEGKGNSAVKSSNDRDLFLVKVSGRRNGRVRVLELVMVLDLVSMVFPVLDMELLAESRQEVLQSRNEADGNTLI